jgi:hypothetical protein
VMGKEYLVLFYNNTVTALFVLKHGFHQAGMSQYGRAQKCAPGRM